MGRVDGCVFDVAGFTQLGSDHLDFHGSDEDYFAAKAALFTPARSRRAVVTVDDDRGPSHGGSIAPPSTQTLGMSPTMRTGRSTTWW